MRHDFTKKLTCPYCNYKYADEQLYDAGVVMEHGCNGETVCVHCGKTFEFNIEVQLIFSTVRIPCTALDPAAEHVYGAPVRSPVSAETAAQWNAEKFCGRDDHVAHWLWYRGCINCDHIEYKRTIPHAPCPFDKGARQNESN